ncbi:hypothetical protein PPTG_23019 [Phytophthora nicotianae INRA-310]|uniref:Uncharacterized protein n=1 Tax=Phytophthora nicotianae (strain INRA-310) TaxID=761204 RepID=W2Q878_PHYN3|nr:hypothetical protein PPTG_23019 [Phytophthora nicotianae INRA-310]ETN08470.1 hypothetical protein PPTG_23019 [Phytophthora nicotianae INRA-310]
MRAPDDPRRIVSGGWSFLGVSEYADFTTYPS